MNNKTRDRHHRFLLSFFAKPWGNNQAINVNGFTLVQYCDPIKNKWFVALWEDYPGNIKGEVKAEV